MSLSNETYDWEDRDRDYRDADDYRGPPHSGMGIASFVIGGLVLISTIAIFIVVAILDQSNSDFFEKDIPDTPEEIALILTYLFNMVLALAGIVLGIIGAATPRRNKLFAGIGIGLNSLILLGLVCVMILGAIFG
jgi:hypothetical protein